MSTFGMAAGASTGAWAQALIIDPQNISTVSLIGLTMIVLIVINVIRDSNRSVFIVQAYIVQVYNLIRLVQ